MSDSAIIGSGFLAPQSGEIRIIFCGSKGSKVPPAAISRGASGRAPSQAARNSRSACQAHLLLVEFCGFADLKDGWKSDSTCGLGNYNSKMMGLQVFGWPMQNLGGQQSSRSKNVKPSHCAVPTPR